MIDGTQEVRLMCFLIILFYKVRLPWIAQAGCKIKIFQVQFLESSRLRCLHPDSAKSLFYNHLESTVDGLELTSDSDRNSRLAGCDYLPSFQLQVMKYQPRNVSIQSLFVLPMPTLYLINQKEE